MRTKSERGKISPRKVRARHDSYENCIFKYNKFARGLLRPKKNLRDGQSIAAAKNHACARRRVESGRPRVTDPKKSAPACFLVAKKNLRDGLSTTTAKLLHTCLINGRGGHISPKNHARNLTYLAEPLIAALILIEALFAAYCNVAVFRWL